MKTISLFLTLLLASITSVAQVKGNKTIETKTFPFADVHTIKINLYAKVIIDNSAKESLEITADSNLFKHIDTEIVDGTIHFDQLKWIQPSKKIIIRIGAPNLKRVIHGTHDTTYITNINNTELRVNANIGKVIIDGKTNELRLGTEIGQIDASNIKANKAYINLWDAGTITVNPIAYLWADVSNDGKLLYTQLPDDNTITTKSGGKALLISEYNDTEKNDLKWISFKIKNNSDNRNHFIVRGPKKDGGFFGYGFPMMPNSKRKEKWSVGTKIYKQTALGFKKLLVVITAEDEGKVVNLF